MATIKKDLKISILVPTYNGAQYILETLKSVLSQNYPNFEIIINDDCSTDNTLDLIKSLQNPKVKIHQNSNNLGYPGNLESGRQHCNGDILFLMGQDDILATGTLKHTAEIFKKYPQVGAITRPYFWFDKKINTPVRAKKNLSCKNRIVKINDSPNKVIRVIDTLDQLSGLAYRTSFIDIPFHPDIFPCHIYPFLSIFKKHPVYFENNNTIAVRIASSQTRSLSSIYNRSPILSWKEMMDNIFTEKKYQKIKNIVIKNFIAKNFIGLVQIKNYSYFKNVIREIFYLIKFNPLNLIDGRFWFFSLGCIIVPPKMLIPMVDFYKNKIYSQSLKYIHFKYKI